MPRYQYRAIDTDGRSKSGRIEAATESAARAVLVRRRLLPLEVDAAVGAEAESSAMRERVSRPGRRLSRKSLLLFTRQLSTLVDASVPLDEALAMIAAQQESPEARYVISEVHAGVIEGQRLTEALARHPRSFSGLYRAAVAAGERSGRLGLVLNRLADYHARAYAMQSKIVTAMIYPSALSVVALSVIVCLMIFVVPSLTEQFERFDRSLPLLTQALIFISNFLTAFWPVLLAALAVGIFVARSMLQREPVRAALDAFALRAPLLGKWAVAVGASRFVRAVATLVASGAPVLESVRAAQEASGNRAMAKAIQRMAERVEEGESFSAAMRRSGVIPPMVCYMAQSGENSGELPMMLEKAADHLDQEFESFTASALSLLEPAIIVVMGLVVASIVLAIMLPILQLNQLTVG